LRNEAVWNRGHVRDMVMTSPPPIGRGTTFEGTHIGFGRATWELVEYERPRHLVVRGLVGRGTYSYEADLEPATGGCELRGRIVWRPVGIVAFFGPLLRPLLCFQAWRSFRHLRRAFESGRPA
jgi:hypothetical protein